MAIPRPAMIALVGAVLIFAAFFATRGAYEAEDASPAPATPAALLPAAPGPSSASPPTGRATRERSGSPADRPGAPADPPGSPADPAGRPVAAPPVAAPPGMPSPAAAPEARRRSPGLPAIAKALAEHKVVVLLFSGRPAADDAATRRSVERLGAGRRLAVFPARIEEAGQYAHLLAGAGVSQLPSVVIVDRRGRARLLEGYVDGGTLSQHVRDALR